MSVHDDIEAFLWSTLRLRTGSQQLPPLVSPLPPHSWPSAYARRTLPFPFNYTLGVDDSTPLVERYLDRDTIIALGEYVRLHSSSSSTLRLQKHFIGYFIGALTTHGAVMNRWARLAVLLDTIAAVQGSNVNESYGGNLDYQEASATLATGLTPFIFADDDERRSVVSVDARDRDREWARSSGGGGSSVGGEHTPVNHSPSKMPALSLDSPHLRVSSSRLSSADRHSEAPTPPGSVAPASLRNHLNLNQLLHSIGQGSRLMYDAEASTLSDQPLAEGGADSFSNDEPVMSAGVADYFIRARGGGRGRGSAQCADTGPGSTAGTGTAATTTPPNELSPTFRGDSVSSRRTASHVPFVDLLPSPLWVFNSTAAAATYVSVHPTRKALHGLLAAEGATLRRVIEPSPAMLPFPALEGLFYHVEANMSGMRDEFVSALSSPSSISGLRGGFRERSYSNESSFESRLFVPAGDSGESSLLRPKQRESNSGGSSCGSSHVGSAHSLGLGGSKNSHARNRSGGGGGDFDTLSEDTRRDRRSRRSFGGINDHDRTGSIGDGRYTQARPLRPYRGTSPRLSSDTASAAGLAALNLHVSAAIRASVAATQPIAMPTYVEQMPMPMPIYAAPPPGFTHYDSNVAAPYDSAWGRQSPFIQQGYVPQSQGGWVGMGMGMEIGRAHV